MGLKVTIITVCWNCIDAIAPTMKSIFDQTYGNIECVVIDGGSTDGTREYLESVRPRLTVFISEKDKGIYDAMNKGIHAASGDYIIFINAGDRLASADVIEKVMTKPEVAVRRPRLVSGRVQFEYRGKLLNRFRPAKSDRGDDCLPHQATFIDARLQKEHLFDDRFRSVADYELWQRLKKLGLFDVLYVPEVIAVFSLGGRSNEIKYDSRRYLERAYVDSLYTNKFDLLDWTKLFLKITLRRVIYKLFGERALHSLLYFFKIRISEKNLK